MGCDETRFCWLKLLKMMLPRLFPFSMSLFLKMSTKRLDSWIFLMILSLIKSLPRAVLQPSYYLLSYSSLLNMLFFSGVVKILIAGLIILCYCCIWKLCLSWSSSSISLRYGLSNFNCGEFASSMVKKLSSLIPLTGTMFEILVERSSYYFSLVRGDESTFSGMSCILCWFYLVDLAVNDFRRAVAGSPSLITLARLNFCPNKGSITVVIRLLISLIGLYINIMPKRELVLKWDVEFCCYIIAFLRLASSSASLSLSISYFSRLTLA